ncbi:hypothetical protein PO124_22505 [Bacillus licheniformis]|nr:hypothetical protein [Bacillus licheniformis]
MIIFTAGVGVTLYELGAEVIELVEPLCPTEEDEILLMKWHRYFYSLSNRINGSEFLNTALVALYALL